MDESEFFHGVGDFSGRLENEVSGIRDFGGQARGFFERDSLRESLDSADGLFERDAALRGMVGADVREDFLYGLNRKGFGDEKNRRIGNWRRNFGHGNRDSGHRCVRQENPGCFRCRNRQYRGHGNPYGESDRSGVFLDSK